MQTFVTDPPANPLAIGAPAAEGPKPPSIAETVANIGPLLDAVSEEAARAQSRADRIVGLRDKLNAAKDALARATQDVLDVRADWEKEMAGG